MARQTILSVETRGPGFYEFTDRAVAFVKAGGETSALLTLFVRHTSCSLLIQENADPDVRRDLDAFFRRLVRLGIKLSERRILKILSELLTESSESYADNRIVESNSRRKLNAI